MKRRFRRVFYGEKAIDSIVKTSLRRERLAKFIFGANAAPKHEFQQADDDMLKQMRDISVRGKCKAILCTAVTLKLSILVFCTVL
jgi:hypothetical protein